MTDDEWKENIKKIADPIQMLKAIVDNEGVLGYDSYYCDLRATLLEQAELIVKKDENEVH